MSIAQDKHRAHEIYPGRASYEFHQGKGSFQYDGFRVTVNGHVIAETEDSEVADFICRQWNHTFFLLPVIESALAWIKHWQRDVECSLKPTTQSLTTAEGELLAAKAKLEGRP